MLRALFLAISLALAAGASVAADAPATLTILEGSALVYRGIGRVHAQEGLQLAGGDIVETGDAAFAQLELADRSVVQLGAKSRAMLGIWSNRQKGTTERFVYLMNGWAKLTGAKQDKPADGGFDLRAPLFEIAAGPAVVVIQASPAEVTMFVEREGARVVERPLAEPPLATRVEAGDYYRRKAGQRGAVNPGATQGFLGEMPRAFRDSLPRRADKFRNADVKARDAPDFAYADVEAWLKAEPSVRRQFVARWKPKVKESSFRAALVANLPSHPEWDPVLFPEKYRPKPPPPPRLVGPPPPPAPALLPAVVPAPAASEPTHTTVR